MLIYSFACTDVGRKRRQNQDSYLLDAELSLFVVADGMGGHKGGEIASALAVQTIEQHMRAHRGALGDQADRVLVDAVRLASAQIRAMAQTTHELEDMGTTTTGILFDGPRAFIAHVGDSRCYLLREGAITQLSEDHSLVFQQVKAGFITTAQARTSPFKNIITRCVGLNADVEVDLVALDVRSADTFLICSDGLCNLVDDEDIARVVGEHFLHRVPEVLIDLANERGGDDNITVVLAYVVDEAALLPRGAPPISTR
jgi:PPM family protein phosphatase